MSPKSILWVLAVTFVIDGVLTPFVPEASESKQTLLHGFIIAVLCYFWCRADADARKSVAPGRSALWAGVFPVIGIPAYFFRTRSAGPATVGVLKALALFVALSVLDYGISEAVRAVRT